MHISRIAILVACFVTYCVPSFPADSSDSRILEKATRLFGKQLSAEHHVFPLNDTYVVWLVLDTRGELLALDVGPRTYYTTEFPNAKNPSKPQYLSEVEYKTALRKISELKDLGELQKPHGTAGPSPFGPLNTDRYKLAFVDRVLQIHQSGSQTEEDVERFNVYFLHKESGSPEQVLTLQEQPMVCLVEAWYYISPDEVPKIRLGRWQEMQVGGPNLHGIGCVRTTTLYDADGFTIEEPQNETIVVSEPYEVKALVGTVYLSDDAIEGVNVEVRLMGSKKVLRTKTNAAGEFSISDAREGKYKFKVTKDGFKSLTGTILVDHKAKVEKLSFTIHLGT
jgi:hypothetical protein